MTAVVMILEGNHPPEVKEQTLCILANIADGNNAKDFIMSNEDILKKLTYYMRHENVKLQVAAVYCINNLVWKEEEGADMRQRKLKEFNVYKQLQSLLTSTHQVLFEKIFSLFFVSRGWHLCTPVLISNEWGESELKHHAPMLISNGWGDESRLHCNSLHNKADEAKMKKFCEIWPRQNQMLKMLKPEKVIK
ncbi:putative armadillo repeat-containing protein 8 [Apostichopus japonicus]|uniref:Putative armadillo repeat-containing protein 8 n=1 Tax=Stichopus japonicus TaxID=307972 RepID=A0A2G8LGZ1_STIJA|nr:putative armadillo repeat-containing protein 8 [Apostichopus japonicus]